ncbi:MAG TPA: beta-N-acetylhexosaminidase [Acidimicrobiales bacterium]|nr:beta-N-acetylhexosaminidase [Acidimicrobiales bacterium]
MIPRPGAVRRGGPSAVLSDGMVIAADEASAAVASLLATELEAATGWRIRRDALGASNPNGTVQLEVRPAGEPGPGQPATEGYQLRVNDRRMEVVAPSAAGVFYGTRTLRQLLPAELLRSAPAGAGVTGSAPAHGPVELEGVEIEDAPRFAWRGAHLDVARHFFPKSFVLRLIDLASLHKLNMLHLHLTDDQGWRIEIDRYPLLTEVGAWRRESPVGHYREGRGDGTPHGGFYTKADLAEIVAYAQRRFVTVVPEVDMPGHMLAAIASYPELGNTGRQFEVYTSWGISDHVLNLEERTVRFCTDVLDELTEIFPSPYIHIGGDECPTTEWEASPQARGLSESLGLPGVGRLQGWFSAQVGAALSAKGRVTVGWTEILEGGAPPGAVVMVWRGEDARQVAIQAATTGHDVVMSPETWTYFDWSYTDRPEEPLAIRPAIDVPDVYGFEPVPAGLPPELAGRIIGTQCQLWTEYVPTTGHAEYLYFPRVCAFSEVAWSPGDKSWDEFEPRLVAHMARLDALGVNYRPLAGPSPGQARTWVTRPGGSLP